MTAMRGPRAALGLAALLIVGCKERREQADSAPATAARGSSSSSSTPWVRVRPAEGLSLLEVPARVLAPPSSAAAVVPPFRARVLRIHVQPGQRCRAAHRSWTWSCPR